MFKILLLLELLHDSPPAEVFRTVTTAHQRISNISSEMEESTVVVVGAGPSGLALAALLGRMKTKAHTTPPILPFFLPLVFPGS